VVIPGSVPRFSGGILRVELENVSYADRAAVVVAAATIGGVDHDPAGVGDTVVPFSLSPHHDLAPEDDYSVRASLVQTDATGGIALQAHTEQIYPVLTRGFAADVTIVLAAWTRPERTS
jgi:hypothetical protein